MVLKSAPEIAADFDTIADALAHAGPREQLSPPERALFQHVPPNAARAIDIGCGDGVITRALARRGLRVLGVDVSRGMIDLARERTQSSIAIEYRLLDIMGPEVPSDTYDVVVSVAMVHHVRLDAVVPRLASLVAPGGVLLLQDVVSRRGVSQLAFNAAAWLSRRSREIITGSRSVSGVAAAYTAHGANESYLDERVVRDIYRELLPEARVQRHLEWRYSVIWQRPVRPA